MPTETITPGRIVTVLVIPPVVAAAVCTLWAIESAAYAYRLWRAARNTTRALVSPGG